MTIRRLDQNKLAPARGLFVPLASVLALAPTGCSDEGVGRPSADGGVPVHGCESGFADDDTTGDGDGDTTGDADDDTTGDGDGDTTGDGDGDTTGDGDGDTTGGGDADTPSGTSTKEQLRVAFIADQGLGPDAEAVLDLVVSEGAAFLLIAGGFDYEDNPAGWDAQTTDRLGVDYPVLGVVSDHDEHAFFGAGGYQTKLAKRLQNAVDDGAVCSGFVGRNSACSYKGLFIAMSGVGVLDGESESEDYLRHVLKSDDAIWSICMWHNSQEDMQVGAEGDETGWGVYQACQDEAAIVITGHEHSYSRTLTLTDLGNEANGHGAAGAFDLMKVSEGSTYVSVVGVGGREIDHFDAVGHDDDTWWSSFYTEDLCWKSGEVVANCKPAPGALFIDFYVDGDPYKARGYVKTIDGTIMDEYEIVRDP
jgi:hypothetical protein